MSVNKQKKVSVKVLVGAPEKADHKTPKEHPHQTISPQAKRELQALPSGSSPESNAATSSHLHSKTQKLSGLKDSCRVETKESVTRIKKNALPKVSTREMLSSASLSIELKLSQVTLKQWHIMPFSMGLEIERPLVGSDGSAIASGLNMEPLKSKKRTDKKAKLSASTEEVKRVISSVFGQKKSQEAVQKEKSNPSKKEKEKNFEATQDGSMMLSLPKRGSCQSEPELSEQVQAMPGWPSWPSQNRGTPLGGGKDRIKHRILEETSSGQREDALATIKREEPLQDVTELADPWHPEEQRKVLREERKTTRRMKREAKMASEGFRKDENQTLMIQKEVKEQSASQMGVGRSPPFWLTEFDRMSCVGNQMSQTKTPTHQALRTKNHDQVDNDLYQKETQYIQNHRNAWGISSAPITEDQLEERRAAKALKRQKRELYRSQKTLQEELEQEGLILDGESSHKIEHHRLSHKKMASAARLEDAEPEAMIRRQTKQERYLGARAKLDQGNLEEHNEVFDMERGVSYELSGFALESAQIGEWDFEINTNRWARSLTHDQCFGYPGGISSWSIEEFMAHAHPDDQTRLRQEFNQSLNGGRFDSQYRVVWPDGSIHWLWSRGRMYLGQDGLPQRATGVTMEISEERALGEKQAYQANHDPLTGLPNRALFQDRLGQALRKAKRSQSKVAVVYLDMDHFKQINDTLGHCVGDQVLIELSRRLEHCKREEDTVSRLGGDEFIFLCPEVHKKEDIEVFLNRLWKDMKMPIMADGKPISCSLSAGVAFFPEHATEASDLIKKADTALYAAKRSGRQHFELFNESMQDEALVQASLEADLKEAMNKQQLYLEYQPTMDFKNHTLISVEALLRWNHPKYGVIKPSRMMPLAEQGGLLLAIGDWTLSQVCQDIKHWESEGLEVVASVNVARAQLRQESFVTKWLETIESAGIKPQSIQAEIHEGALELPGVEDKMRALALAGVSVCMDDFGAGHCALARIARLPLTTVKMEKGLTRSIEESQRSAAVLKQMLSLAYELNIEPIAKGIEQKQLLDALVGMGCHKAQGHAVAMPMQAVALEAWIKRQ